MKKIMIFLAFVLCASLLHAGPGIITPANPDPFSVLNGQFEGALITHVQAVDQVTSKGNKLALVDSVLLMGHLKNDFLAHGRVGYSATRNPDGTYTGGGMQASLFLPINNLVKSYIVIPAQYGFLNGLQYGPSVGYDFAAHHDFFSIDVGWQYGPSTN